MKDPLSMQEYLYKIKQIKYQLTASGESISDIDILIYILKDLPESYRPFQIAIRICAKYAPMTVKELHSLLLVEELSLDESSNLT